MISVRKKFALEAGYSLLEFCVILPAILLLIFGVMDLTSFYQTKAAIQRASEATLTELVKIGGAGAQISLDTRIPLYDWIHYGWDASGQRQKTTLSTTPQHGLDPHPGCNNLPGDEYCQKRFRGYLSGPGSTASAGVNLNLALEQLFVQEVAQALPKAQFNCTDEQAYCVQPSLNFESAPNSSSKLTDYESDSVSLDVSYTVPMMVLFNSPVLFSASFSKRMETSHINREGLSFPISEPY